jgi:lysophospholipase L1-like esterase
MKALAGELRTAGVAALMAVAACSLLAATTPVKKKHRAPAAGASSAHAVVHGVRASTKAHMRARVHYTIPLNPARRAALEEEIGARLKEPAAHAITYNTALDGFYAQLASHEASAHDASMQTGTVRVLQFGDSHTAADMFTGEARRVFQAKFGDGGIGYSYAGHPFAGYRILGSERGQSVGWKTEGNKFLHLGDGVFGMGGISISTERANEWVTLGTQCSTLELQYLEQPGGGSLRFTDNDSVPVEIDTDASQPGPGTFTYTCTAGEHSFRLETEKSAPVTLFGWVATQPGVTWESIGINGAEAPLILKWDQVLFSRYLKDNSPALIVLAYGTNEAASSAWDEQSYEQTFANLIDTIHSYVPESSILVVGPPDRSLGSRRRAYHPFTGTDHIIAAQKAVCSTHSCAYWDQRERMGGLGSMQEWFYAGWAQPDHTHFTGDGYRALADTLMADLMTGYQNYKERNPNTGNAVADGTSDGSTSTNR